MTERPKHAPLFGSMRELMGIDRFERTWKRMDVRALRWHYERTQNPLFAWEAYRISRELGDELPSWVSEYLDRAAGNLNDIRNPDSKKVPQEIQKALEMVGGRSVFTYYRVELLKLKAASRVQELRDEEEATIPAVFEQVAREFNVSSGNVSDWYYEVRDRLDDPV